MTFHLVRLYFVLAVLSSVLVGCANLPEVNYTYYETDWKAVAIATQTLGCSKDNKRLSSKLTPGVIPTFFSNRERSPHSININNLSHWYASSDFKMTFTDDGRLKSIEQSTTGEGEAIMKSVVSFASAVALMAIQEQTTEQRCRTINREGGNKPITLTYKSEPITWDATMTLSPTEESTAMYDRLHAEGAIEPIVVTATMEKASEAGAHKITDTCSSIPLKLQTMRPVRFVFTAGKLEIPSEAPIFVPTSETYELPILKARLFGKQSFAITLTDAGAVQSVSYGKLPGGAGLGNALTAVAGAEAATLTSKANEIQAKADILANQHRIVICETKPDECGK